MGGHGGLNILPQKRWNVYNRDNRLKVARDEAAHAAEQAVQQEKHRAAEAQARRQLLLERAKERRVAALGGQQPTYPAGQDAHTAAADEHEQQAEHQHQHQHHRRSAPSDEAHTHGDRDECRPNKRPRLQEQQDQVLAQEQVLASTQDMQNEEQQQQEPVLEHINFWKEFETKAQHPERQAEERAKKKKRGNPDTYTTDVRFDESFQLAYGLTGPKPWYARAVNPAAADDDARRLAQPRQQQQWLRPPQLQQQQQQQQELPALPGVQQSGQRERHKRKRRKHSSSSSSSSDDSSSSESASSRERRRRRHRRSRSSSRDRRDRKGHKQHSKHKAKHHRRRSAAKSAADEDAVKAAGLAQLRAERLEREAAEKRRALEALGLSRQPNKSFNNSYGYADALRRGQVNAASVVAARGASAAAVAGLSQRFKV